LHPRKAITSGEGGLLVTSDQKLDCKIKTIRNHGIEPDSIPMNFVAAGFNCRMTDFQAALVKSQFLRLNKILNLKSNLASVYFNEIKHNGIRLPQIPAESSHTWQTFHILLNSEKERNRLMVYLKENGVLTNYGAQCIPATKFYKEKYSIDAEKNYPNAYEAYTCGLAIPLYEKLTEKQIKYISKLLNNFK
jgi:dTDP-4-amino-4,6-dideoxygalactose transaminase